MHTKIRKNILTIGLLEEKSSDCREAKLFLSLDGTPVIKTRSEKKSEKNEDSVNGERGDIQA